MTTLSCFIGVDFRLIFSFLSLKKQSIANVKNIKKTSILSQAGTQKSIKNSDLVVENYSSNFTFSEFFTVFWYY